MAKKVRINVKTTGGYDILHPETEAGQVAMTGYAKPASCGAVSASDTVSAAIGKLERSLDRAGHGDMNKVTYDTEDRGYVDRAVLADNAEKLGGESPEYYRDAEKLGGHSASYFVPATKPAIISFSGGGITWEANWAWFDGRQVHVNFSGRATAGTDAISGAFAQLPASIPRPSGDFFIPAFFRKAANDTVHFGRIVVSTSGQISASADSGGGWMAVMAVGCYPAG